MNKLLLFCLAALVIFNSCRFQSGKRIRGNGNLVTSERSVGAFRGVESHGFFDIYLTTDAASSVKVEAEDNLQEYIEIGVEDGVLKIRQRDNINLRPKRDVKIHISAPMFERARVFGSGDIKSQNKLQAESRMNLGIHGSGEIDVDIDAPEVETSIRGSGTAKISGLTKNFKGEITGSGDIRAMELKSEEARVEIMGSGDAEIFASMKLDVSVRGSGDVRYRGEANVTSNISGSGSVKKMD